MKNLIAEAYRDIFDMSLVSMFATAIIPVGSLRQRHIFGVNRLREFGKVDAFVIAETSEKSPQGAFSVLRNARKVREELGAEMINANPIDEAAVSRCFMEIYERQMKKFMEILKQRKEQNGKQPKYPIFYVDITSTTKVVIRVTFIFAILFGFRPYTIAARKRYSNIERTSRILADLFDPDLSDLNEINRIMSRYHARPKEALRMLEQLLQKRTSEIGYMLKAQSIGVSIQRSQMPVVIPIKLTPKDRLALKRLHDNDDSYESIKDLALAMGLKGRSNRISLGYRIKKLTQWALVSDTGSEQEFTTESDAISKPRHVGAKRRIILTPIGRGIAEALKRSDDESANAEFHSNGQATWTKSKD